MNEGATDLHNDFNSVVPRSEGVVTSGEEAGADSAGADRSRGLQLLHT